MALTDDFDRQERAKKAAAAARKEKGDKMPLNTNIVDNPTMAPMLPKPGMQMPPTENRPRDHVLG